MPQHLSEHTAELERRVQELADVVKRELREYRETLRASSASVTEAIGVTTRVGPVALLREKQLGIQRANAEYMRVQKELDLLKSETRR